VIELPPGFFQREHVREPWIEARLDFPWLRLAITRTSRYGLDTNHGPAQMIYMWLQEPNEPNWHYPAIGFYIPGGRMDKPFVVKLDPVHQSELQMT